MGHTYCDEPRNKLIPSMFSWVLMSPLGVITCFYCLLYILFQSKMDIPAHIQGFLHRRPWQSLAVLFKPAKITLINKVFSEKTRMAQYPLLCWFLTHTLQSISNRRHLWVASTSGFSSGSFILINISCNFVSMAEGITITDQCTALKGQKCGSNKEQALQLKKALKYLFGRKLVKNIRTDPKAYYARAQSRKTSETVASPEWSD